MSIKVEVRICAEFVQEEFEQEFDCITLCLSAPMKFLSRV